jgi:predicted unusual protein kinase regulating ubiquinone biosynthesis (AarF/ABC1/UbiB family)
MTWLLDDRDISELVRDADLQSLFSISNDAAHPSDWMKRLWSKNELQGVVAIPVLQEMRALAAVTIKQGYIEFQKLSLEKRLKILAKIGDKPYLKAIEQVNARLASAQVSNSPAIQALMGPENLGEIAGMPKEKADEMKLFITQYFDKLTISDKRRVLIAYLGLPPKAPIEKQIGIILQNCGPVMQKLFQQIGRDSRSSVIRGVLKELLANVKPSGIDPRETIEQETGLKVDQIFKELDRKPGNTGTVGEVYKGTLLNGKEVMVKILRPGILQAAQREFVTLREVAGDNPVLQRVESNLEAKFLDEIDLRKEAANIIEGRKYIDAAKGIAIADLAGNVPPTQNVLIIERASGKSLDKGAVVGPVLDRGQALANLLEVWLDRGVFGDGKLHADLHGGNLFFESLPGKNPPFKLTLIDFGSFGQLGLAERRGFVKFSVAVLGKSAEDTVDALGEMCDVHFDEAMRKSLVEKFRNFYLKPTPLRERPGAALFFGTDEGAPFSANMMQFSRGWSLIEGDIKDVNKELAEVDAKKKLPRFDPGKILAKVAVKRIGRDVSRQTLQKVSSAAKRLAGRPAAAMNVGEEQFLPLSYWHEILKKNLKKVLSTIGQSCVTSLRTQLAALLHPSVQLPAPPSP